MRRLPRNSALVAPVAILLALAACSSAGSSKGEIYCGTVRDDLSILTAPSIVDGTDIEAVLDTYRAITSRAPIAVQPEWQDVVDSLETAATVDPNDSASLQRAADAARRAQPSVTRIQQYTQQTCGLDIGVPPPTTNPRTAPVTTIDSDVADTTSDG